MAFVTKTWKDRLVEYAGRRKLKNVATGEEVLMDVSRSEGTVSQAGDAFSAANMNNLEQRIKNEFDTLNSSLNGLSFAQDENGKWGYKVGADAVIPFKKDNELLNISRLYHTAIAINGTYTAYQTFIVIPKANLKSISFTTNNLSSSAQNDVRNYKLPCIFIGSVNKYDTLLLSGVDFITPGFKADSFMTKTVIYRNGSYSFDDFSDCYDYIVFGFGTTATYSRYYLTDVSIELI